MFYSLINLVIIKDDGFFKWISCSCKCMEELSLQEVHSKETITIESSSLKKFSFSAMNVSSMLHMDISCENLDDICIVWVFDSPRNKSLNICAPNLKKFHWSGNLVNHSNLRKLQSVEEGAIVFLEPGTGRDDLDNAFEGLHSLCRAKYLILNEETVN